MNTLQRNTVKTERIGQSPRRWRLHIRILPDVPEFEEMEGILARREEGVCKVNIDYRRMSCPICREFLGETGSIVMASRASDDERWAVTFEDSSIERQYEIHLSNIHGMHK